MCNAQRAVNGKVKVPRATSRDASLYASLRIIAILRSTHSLDLDCSLKAAVKQIVVPQLPPSAIVRCTACRAIKCLGKGQGTCLSRRFFKYWSNSPSEGPVEIGVKMAELVSKTVSCLLRKIPHRLSPRAAMKMSCDVRHRQSQGTFRYFGHGRSLYDIGKQEGAPISLHQQ